MNIKYIKDAQFSFLDFYQALCGMLNEKGKLDQIVIEGCTVTDIPKNYLIIEQKFIKKIMGIPLYKVNDRFFGFKIKGVRINNNLFKAVDADENSPSFTI